MSASTPATSRRITVTLKAETSTKPVRNVPSTAPTAPQLCTEPRARALEACRSMANLETTGESTPSTSAGKKTPTKAQEPA